MAKKFPKILYAVIEEDGNNSYFSVDETLIAHAGVEPRKVAVYERVAVGTVRDLQVCKFTPDQ